MDLGVCKGQLFSGVADRAALLLPGARYVPAAPLLWFTREVLEAKGWTVLQVWDEWDRSVEADQWVAERFQAGLDLLGHHANLLVVAKSLTTLALPSAVEMALPGIWLTPLLVKKGCGPLWARSQLLALSSAGRGIPHGILASSPRFPLSTFWRSMGPIMRFSTQPIR